MGDLGFHPQKTNPEKKKPGHLDSFSVAVSLPLPVSNAFSTNPNRNGVITKQ
jgi:hypothetical protein